MVKGRLNENCELWKEDLNLKIVSLLLVENCGTFGAKQEEEGQKCLFLLLFVIVLSKSVTSTSNSCHHLPLLVFVSHKMYNTHY